MVFRPFGRVGLVSVVGVGPRRAHRHRNPKNELITPRKLLEAKRDVKKVEGAGKALDSELCHC